MTNTAVQTKNWQSQNIVERRSTIEELLRKNKDKLQLALPKHLTPDKLIGTVMTSIARNPKLLECTQASFFGAVFTAAQLGLNPNGILGEGYLLPYRNRKKNTLECQFIPGYRGYLKLAYQSGQVKTMQATVVYSKDFFEYELGLNQKLIHRPAPPPRGEALFVYTIVHLINGGVLFDVMYKDEVEIIRTCSKNIDGEAWTKWPDEMWKKTGIRRLQKITPLSEELEKTAGLDEKTLVLDESQNNELALSGVNLSPEIDKELEDSMIQDAEIVNNEEKSEAVNEAKEKSEAAMNSALNQAKKNGNGELKKLQEGVAFYQNQVKEATLKSDTKAIVYNQEKLDNAVKAVNEYLKKKNGGNK